MPDTKTHKKFHDSAKRLALGKALRDKAPRVDHAPLNQAVKSGKLQATLESWA